ncbi:MAG: hypothetical protein RL616_2037 [Verrucomicrobiota bacterium]
MLPCAAGKKNLYRFALVFAVVVAGFFSALAAAPNYFTRIWQVEQGLPQNKVTAVTQTRDGYLWLGTYNGLARFDGVHFKVFDDKNTPELRSSRITSLFEAADGMLWIGTESGDVSQCKDGRFSAVPLHGNWSGRKIYAITADDAGDVWLFNETGELVRVRDGKVLSPVSGNVPKVLALVRGLDGTVWIDREGVVSSLKAGETLTCLRLLPELVCGHHGRSPWQLDLPANRGWRRATLRARSQARARGLPSDALNQPRAARPGQRPCQTARRDAKQRPDRFGARAHARRSARRIADKSCAGCDLRPSRRQSDTWLYSCGKETSSRALTRAAVVGSLVPERSALQFGRFWLPHRRLTRG